MDIWVNSASLVLITAIIWWFWLSRPKAVTQQQGTIEIVVENGVYTPAHIRAKRGETLVLKFLRKDPSPCAEKVIFDKLNLSVDLPVDNAVEVQVTPEETGEIEFTCQMQMYRGSLMVE